MGDQSKEKRLRQAILECENAVDIAFERGEPSNGLRMRLTMLQNNLIICLLEQVLEAVRGNS